MELDLPPQRPRELVRDLGSIAVEICPRDKDDHDGCSDREEDDSDQENSQAHPSEYMR